MTYVINAKMACYIQRFWNTLIGRVSKTTFERRRSTQSGIFAFLGVKFAKCFEQIVSIRVKKLVYTNLIASRQIKGKKAWLPVDVRHAKTSLLKLIVALETSHLKPFPRRLIFTAFRSLSDNQIHILINFHWSALSWRLARIFAHRFTSGFKLTMVYMCADYL